MQATWAKAIIYMNALLKNVNLLCESLTNLTGFWGPRTAEWTNIIGGYKVWKRKYKFKICCLSGSCSSLADKTEFILFM